MLKILKQTREEERSMYDKLPKSMLIEMLINCNDVITILTQEKNCITPKEVEKLKQPLFTTEDNVDIFEGDKFFQLAVSFSPNFREAIYEEIAKPNIRYSYNCKEGREQLNKNGRYYFSTKEAAEEYALTVKPCLSIKDILKRFNSRWSEVTETTLKELVKSKI